MFATLLELALPVERRSSITWLGTGRLREVLTNFHTSCHGRANFFSLKKEKEKFNMSPGPAVRILMVSKRRVPHGTSSEHAFPAHSHARQ